MITDINNPAASAMAQGDRRYTGEPLAPGIATDAPADVAVAGVLPVRIDLPLEGIAHQFRRALVPQGKSLELNLYTYSSRFRPLSTLIVLGLGLVIGVSIGRLVLLRLVEQRMAGSLLAAIGCGVVLLVTTGGVLRIAIRPAWAGIVVGLIVAFLPWLSARIAERARTQRAEPELQQQGG
jgi:hypothetical protein